MKEKYMKTEENGMSRREQNIYMENKIEQIMAKEK
jgi:hypothetical protein